MQPKQAAIKILNEVILGKESLPYPGKSEAWLWIKKNFKLKKVCHWIYNSDGFYASECGASWCFEDGNIKDNGVKYCHKCGGKVKEKKGK